MLCLSPLGLVLMNQACAPMKSKLNSETVGIASSKSVDVCSADYAPSSVIFNKAARLANQDVVLPFEEHKVYLNDDSSTMSKAVSSLKNQKVIVILRKCDVNEPTSLSAKVLSQSGPFPAHRASSAFQYTVNEDISSAEFETSANHDPCVAGVTLPGVVRTSSLSLPKINDTDLTKLTQLSVTNYLHAFENLVAIQKTTSAKARVAMVDTGIDCTHPDLAANIESGCGKNMVDPSLLPTDNDGHGSHTAGIVGAVYNNGRGVAGIAGNAIQLSSYKVIDVGTGTVDDTFNGIQEAISSGVDVINISLQSSTRLISIENAVGEAVRAGIVVVMAAGNQGGSLMESVVVSPAAIGKSLAGAITVGSIDASSGDLSYFSNYGGYVEIAAPGAVDGSSGSVIGGIYSTYKNGKYQKLMGTSQAAPMVAGAAALLIQFFKDHNVTYTPAMIEQIILVSTDSPFYIPVDGHRVINFSKLTRNAYKQAGISLCDGN